MPHMREVLEKKVISEKVPILGVCLGMQLFTRGSEEGNQIGFGWISADTKRFPSLDGIIPSDINIQIDLIWSDITLKGTVVFFCHFDISNFLDVRKNKIKQMVSDKKSDLFISEDPKVYEKELEDRDYYTQDNVFWVPQKARWEKLFIPKQTKLLH